MAITKDVKSIMNITPEEYYFNTVRPLMDRIVKEVRYDDVMTDTVAEIMNRSDGFAVHKKYKELNTAFQPIGHVLLNSKSQYTKEKLFVSASEEEKKLIIELGDKVTQLFTIIKCTPEETGSEKSTEHKRQRLNYDETRKENLIIGRNEF